MAEIKHVGRNINTKQRCIVAYRVVPRDPDYCIVVHTQSLNAEQHDSLIRLVESNAGQTAYEFAEAMDRERLPDGRNMLATFHNQGKLVKTLTKDIEMVPNQQTTVNLAELNEMIAKSRGVTVTDLSLGITNAEEKKAKIAAGEIPESTKEDTVSDPAAAYGEQDVLTDEKLAEQYRSQADALDKEAQSLREEAEKLSPTKKATPAKKAAPTKKATPAKKTSGSKVNANASG